MLRYNASGGGADVNLAMSVPTSQFSAHAWRPIVGRWRPLHCRSFEQGTALENAPDWAADAVYYQLNIQFFTPEGNWQSTLSCRTAALPSVLCHKLIRSHPFVCERNVWCGAASLGLPACTGSHDDRLDSDCRVTISEQQRQQHSEPNLLRRAAPKHHRCVTRWP